MSMSQSEWLERFGAKLDVEPPSDELIDEILAIAGIAAHASVRTAAPISAWMIGKAGGDVCNARIAAQQVAGEATEPT
jgi:hypothetical protein